MDTNTIQNAVMRGVKHHLFMDESMSTDHLADYEYVTVAQVALCILTAAGVGNEWDGETTRTFLTNCGIPEPIAEKMIYDDQPQAIY